MNALDQIERQLSKSIAERADAPIAPAPGMVTTARDVRGALLRRSVRARVRHRWQRRSVAGVLAVLVVASGAAAATISLSSGSSPPVPLPGGNGQCPLGFPYVADASLKLAYPGNYPAGVLSQVHVTNCFASAQSARAAGYAIAAPPAGYAKLGALYVTSAPAAVRRTCQRAQRLTHEVVYCPTRLPAGWATDNLGNPDCPTAGCSAPFLSLSGSFLNPDSKLPASPGISNASIWEASIKQLRHYPIPIGCGGAWPNAHTRLISHTSFRGHPAAWYQCPDAGPVMLKWQIGQESYGITANGPAKLRSHLIQYIAAHLVAQQSPS